jgi:Tfp pilus assembly PilM family ATPase
MNAILESVLKLEPGTMTEQLKRDKFARLIANPADSGITKEQFLELFNSIVEPVLKELEYSLDLFLRQSANQNKRPEKIILTGGSALFPFLADHIATKFKMRCYIGDPWGRVVYQESLKPILHAIGPRMSSAIGLALRNVIV